MKSQRPEGIHVTGNTVEFVSHAAIAGMITWPDAAGGEFRTSLFRTAGVGARSLATASGGLLVRSRTRPNLVPDAAPRWAAPYQPDPGRTVLQ